MSELQTLVDEALADWYTECRKFEKEEDESEITSSLQPAPWCVSDIDPRLVNGVIAKMHIPCMTSVQKLAIPAILSGQNLIATAETGSGKTLAFVLPICHMILTELEAERGPPRRAALRCVALSPTREIAIQTHKVVELVTEGLPVQSAVICGGLKHSTQEQTLRRSNHFICACPGRLLDLLGQEAFQQKARLLRWIVLDEADRMLGLGFAEDVEKILATLRAAQVLLFAAAVPAHVHALASAYMTTPPIRISVLEGGGVCRCENIKEVLLLIRPLLKLDLLRYLLLSCTDIACVGSNADLIVCREPRIENVRGGQCIIFTRTKARANRVCERLRLSGFSVERIHGNRSQSARVKALKLFTAGECQVLVATDVAARGIDLYEVPLVINFDLPATGEEYTHRAGRAGRAGREGQCWSFVSELAELAAIEQGLGRELRRPLVEDLAGFSFKTHNPSFLITESGHEHEIFPPAQTPPKPARHRRLQSARHRRAPPTAPLDDGTPSTVASAPRRPARPGRGAVGIFPEDTNVMPPHVDYLRVRPS